MTSSTLNRVLTALLVVIVATWLVLSYKMYTAAIQTNKANTAALRGSNDIVNPQTTLPIGNYQNANVEVQ